MIVSILEQNREGVRTNEHPLNFLLNLLTILRAVPVGTQPLPLDTLPLPSDTLPLQDTQRTLSLGTPCTVLVGTLP